MTSAPAVEKAPVVLPFTAEDGSQYLRADKVPDFSGTERCDRCTQQESQAIFRIATTGGLLGLCGHHFRKEGTGEKLKAISDAYRISGAVVI